MSLLSPATASPADSARRRRASSSGASAMQVPSTRSDCRNARMPVSSSSGVASPSVSKPRSSGVSVSQFANRRPQSLSSALFMRFRAFSGYQMLSW